MKSEKSVKKQKRREKVKEIKDGIKQEVFLNIPNSLTLSRLIISFIVVGMIFSGLSRLSVAVVFAIAALTDTLDGFLARRLNQTTKIGARLDQVVDRISTVLVILALVIYFFIYNHGNLVFLFLISSREIVGFPGLAIRIIRNKDAYKVKYIGKVTTFIQAVTLSFLILGVSWIIWLVIPTFIIGILSGFDYLKDSVS